MFLWRKTGLPVPVPGPRLGPDAEITLQITDEAALTADAEDDLRVIPLVAKDEAVAQGQPILKSRRHTELVYTAPMAGRMGAIGLGPGRRLSEVRIFREDGPGRHEFDRTDGGDAMSVATAMQRSGLWQSLRSRPFGRVPLPGERPAAIFVMAVDSRPGAADPRRSVEGQEAAVARGIEALLALTEGPVYLCGAGSGSGSGSAATDGLSDPRLKPLRTPALHPWGLAGFQIHSVHPAAVGRAVWDVQIEDVAAIGSLLATGLLPETRLVAFGGPAAKAARLIRCQPGADLRGLSYGCVQSGPHALLSGSALDGVKARWLRRRDRQVSVVAEPQGHGPGHWLRAALTGSSGPVPSIPSAAIDRAMGGALPAMHLLRALSAGDRETVMALGALSFVGEDLALLDYVTGGDVKFSRLLKAMLRAVEEEEAA